MYEFEMRNVETNETSFGWGYSKKDMLRRNPSFDNDKWIVVFCEYID